MAYSPTLRFIPWVVCAILFITSCAESPTSSRPVFKEDGTVNVPSFDLPPSEFASQQAREQLMRRAQRSGPLPTMEPDIEKSRAGLTIMMAPRVAQIKKLYPVDIRELSIGGIPTRVVTPKDGDIDPDRVLINLHGGAFTTCWESCSIIESAPIAVKGGYKVISVNYRMAPEAVHPAGVQDVAQVYKHLLDEYDPKHIGIYGCSAGGALSAQAAAWLPANGLPQTGAIGIFSAGGTRFTIGDSAYIAGYIDSTFPPPPKPGQPAIDMTRGYFADADESDAIVSPTLHMEVLKNFPPALIITGTRAMDMSPAIVTNSQLIKAGISSTLIVGEGMGHCYIYSPQLPETQDAYAAIVNFFKNNLIDNNVD